MMAVDARCLFDGALHLHDTLDLCGRVFQDMELAKLVEHRRGGGHAQVIPLHAPISLLMVDGAFSGRFPLQGDPRHTYLELATHNSNNAAIH